MIYLYIYIFKTNFEKFLLNNISKQIQILKKLMVLRLENYNLKKNYINFENCFSNKNDITYKKKYYKIIKILFIFISTINDDL